MNLRKNSGKKNFFWLIRHPEKVQNKDQVHSTISYDAAAKSLFVAYKLHWATTLLILVYTLYLHVTYKQHGASRDRPFIAKTPYPCDL